MNQDGNVGLRGYKETERRNQLSGKGIYGRTGIERKMQIE